MEETNTSSVPQSTAAAPVVSTAERKKANKLMDIFLENVAELRESIITEQAKNPTQDAAGSYAVTRRIKAARNSLENLFLELETEDAALVHRTAVNTDELMSVISKLLDGRAQRPVHLEELLDEHGIVSLLFVKDVRAPSTGNGVFDTAGLTANKAAFDSAGYQNGGFLGLFLNVLSWFALQWSSIYYAPYSALINASMTGKSRSMAELASVGVFTFISCFRPQTDPFYRPRRTPKIADWGTKKTEDLLVFTRQACQYFTGCLEVLLEFLTTTGQDVAASIREREKRACKIEDLTRAWREARDKEERDGTQKQHDDGATLWGKVWMKMEVADAIVDQVRSQERSIEQKAHLVIGKFRKDLSRKDGLIAKIWKQLFLLVPDLPKNKLHILFAFDEARNLKKAVSTEAKDNFVALRRAMRVLPHRLVADEPDAPATPAVDVGPAELELVSTRAAGEHKTELNMFCLVTDTTSAIGNLAPPKELDPSERAGYTGIKLFHPFVNLMGFDSWWRSAGEVLVPKASQSSSADIVNAVKTALLPRIKEASDGQIKQAQEDHNQQDHKLLKQGGNDDRDFSAVEPQAKRAKLAVERSGATDESVGEASGTPFRELLSMEVLETVEVASMQGRPAFFPNLCARGELSAQAELTELLMSKILCVDWKAVTSDPSKPFEPSQTQLIAVLGTVASIEISAASELASALSSGHMRPAAGVSRDRHLLYTLEISELLMAASARLLMRYPSMSLSRLLQAFRETQLNSTTLPGFVGEFAGQVLLLMADETVRRSPTFSDGLQLLDSPFAFYPLLDLLRALLGKDFVDSLGDEVRETFQGGYVRLLQFVKTFAPLSRKTLFEYLLRGSGVYCQEMQRGADLGLGVFYPPADSLRDPRLEPVTLGCTGAALVQVKNLSSPMKPSQVQAAFSKLEELHNAEELSSDLPRVSILLELHRPASSSKDGDWNVQLHKPYSPVRKILEIHARGLSVADILVDEKDKVSADAAFRQMLKSIVDPKTVETIPSEFRDLVEHMFTVQPYMADPKSVPVDKFPLK